MESETNNNHNEPAGNSQSGGETVSNTGGSNPPHSDGNNTHPSSSETHGFRLRPKKDKIGDFDHNVVKPKDN